MSILKGTQIGVVTKENKICVFSLWQHTDAQLQHTGYTTLTELCVRSEDASPRDSVDMNNPWSVLPNAKFNQNNKGDCDCSYKSL